MLLLACSCNHGSKQEMEALRVDISILQRTNDSLLNVVEKQKKELSNLNSEIESYMMNPEKLCANIDDLYKKEDLKSLKEIYSKLSKYHPESLQCKKVAEYISKIETAIQKRAAEEIAKKEKATKEAEAKRLQAVNKLKKKFDDVSGITWYYNPYFTHYTNSNHTSIYMGKKDDGRPWLRLKMSYEGDDWIFFEQAYLSYDGNTKEIAFNKYKDKESDNSGGSVWEWIDVSVDDSLIMFLKELVKGKEVKMRLSGKYSKTKTLTKNEIKGIEDVLLGYDVLKAN